jgi:hypothetical protein
MLVDAGDAIALQEPAKLRGLEWHCERIAFSEWGSFALVDKFP